MSRRVRHIHADDDEYIAVHRTRSSSGGGDGGEGCVIWGGVALGALALYVIWCVLCWIWANIIMILIGLGCIIGFAGICFLLWYFRKTLLKWGYQVLKFLTFLIFATGALLFWEVPKWLYQQCVKIKGKK